MYIGSGSLLLLASSSTNRSSQLFEGSGLHHYLSTIWSFIVGLSKDFGSWLLQVAPLTMTWIFDASSTAYAFVRTHPHPFHITLWSIFFGPIIILLPCLLILELTILLLFNLSFFSHGQIPGTLDDQYDQTKEYFMESREKLFANVENATTVYNQWTSDHPALLVSRLLAGVLGLCILFELSTRSTW